MTELEMAIKKYADDLGISVKEAKADAESLITEQMKMENVPREFAEATFIEDTLDADKSAIDEMTNKARTSGTNKPKARSVDAYGKTRIRTVKQDDEKRGIIQTIFTALQETFGNMEIVNNQQKIDIHVNDNYYSISLTKHREKKT